MEDNKVVSVNDLRNRLKVNKQDLKEEKTSDDYEERKKGKVVEPFLEDEMIARMKQLRKEYINEDIIIGIFTSEFERRYIGDIEEYAKKLLDDLKKGNESR